MNMNRRIWMGVVGAWPWLSHAQPTRVFKIGLLAHDMGPPETMLLEALANMGYRDGQTITLIRRLYEGEPQAVNTYAAELVAQKPDLIIAGNNVDIIALQKQTTTIPIVMRRSFAPVNLGFIKAYSHPGGNITGVTHWQPADDAKTMQILHDFAPAARRYCTLYDPRLIGIQYYKDQQAKTCKELGLNLLLQPMRDEADLNTYFKRAVAEKHQILEFPDSGYIGAVRDELIAFCEKRGIITMSSREAAVRAGVVLARVPDVQAQPQRCAAIIDRILKGAAPADIPVEGPMRYEVLLNETAAKKIHVPVPRAFRVQVTRLVT